MKRATNPQQPDHPAAPVAPSGEYEQLPEEGDEQERAAREWLRHSLPPT